MILVYTPRGTKKKSKINLQETVNKYLTNGRYDQRKSDMLAVTHKQNMLALQKRQGLARKGLSESAMVFNNIENLVAKTLVWEEVIENNNKLGVPTPQKPVMVINHGRRKIN